LTRINAPISDQEALTLHVLTLQELQDHGVKGIILTLETILTIEMQYCIIRACLHFRYIK